MKEQCYLVPGEFGVMVQVFIGCVSLSLLFTKYRLENPRRLFLTFFKDLISILCGSMLLHFGNIFLCIMISRSNILLYLCDIDMDECSIYFVQIIIDATIGLYLEYKIFPIYKFIKVRRKYLCNNSNSSIYKPVDALSQYSAFLKFINKSSEKQFDDPYNTNDKSKQKFFKIKLPGFSKFLGKEKDYTLDKNQDNTTEIVEESFIKQEHIYNINSGFYNYNKEKILNENFLQNNPLKIYHSEDDNENELSLLNDKIEKKNFNTQLNENLLYDYEDIIIYEYKNLDIYKETEGKHTFLNLLHSVVLWTSVVITAKTITLLFFFICSPLFNIFVLHTISFISNMRFKLLIVMVIVPFFLNFIIYFFTDNIIKTNHTYMNINYDKL